MDERPLCVDLFCGLGGGAEGFLREGYRVVGFDNDPRFAKVYPGEFVLQDVRTLDGRRFRGARCIVASPPCTEYSTARWANPRYRHRLHETPDPEAWEAAERLRRESGIPTVIENIQGAVRWRGPWQARYGHHRLWGDVPALIPDGPSQVARSRNAALRAKIPLPLARAVARGFL